MSYVHLKRFVLLALLIAFLPIADVSARPSKHAVKVRKIQGQKFRTPEYKQVGGTAQGITRFWYRILVEYDTYPAWMNELDVTYYVLVRPSFKLKKEACTMLKGTITYVNVPRGRRRQSVAFLHPRTLKRFGDVEAMAVTMHYKGKLVALYSNPRARRRWWERYTPVSGYLLNRLETPFAMIRFDDYENIKSTTAR